MFAATTAIDRSLDAKAFAATALALGVGICEFEAFVDTLFYKIHLRAVYIDQALRVNNNLDTLVLKNLIPDFQLVHEFQHVCHAGTAGGFYPDPNTKPMATARQLIGDMPGSSFCN